MDALSSAWNYASSSINRCLHAAPALAEASCDRLRPDPTRPMALMVLLCSLMGVEGELAVVDPTSREAGSSNLADSQDVGPSPARS